MVYPRALFLTLYNPEIFELNRLSVKSSKNRHNFWVICHFNTKNQLVVSGFFDLNSTLRRSWGLRQSLRPRRCGDPHIAIRTKNRLYTCEMIIYFLHPLFLDTFQSLNFYQFSHLKLREKLGAKLAYYPLIINQKKLFLKKMPFQCKNPTGMLGKRSQHIRFSKRSTGSKRSMSTGDHKFRC